MGESTSFHISTPVLRFPASGTWRLVFDYQEKFWQEVGVRLNKLGFDLLACAVNRFDNGRFSLNIQLLSNSLYAGCNCLDGRLRRRRPNSIEQGLGTEYLILVPH